MTEPAVRVERRDGVAWCALNRPPLNLVEPGLIAGLRETFAGLAADPTVRLAVLGGEGRAFTAGMDLNLLATLDPLGGRAFITALQGAIGAVHAAPFPVIAALHGACFGAGFELALACDLRVAAAGTRLGLPEVRVGVPSVIEAALLPPLVGPGRAAEILLTGEAITAETALGWGLVNRVAPADRLREAVDELARPLLASGPAAIRLQKELMIRWRGTDLPTAIAYGINAFAAACATGEAAEGARAFLEKRRPRFEEPA